MYRKLTNKGFGLPSVIIGSIVAAVLGTMATGSMWESVDKAKNAATLATITEIKSGLTALMEERGGFPSELDDYSDSFLKQKITNLPPTLEFRLIYAKMGTATTSDDVIWLKIVGANQSLEGLSEMQSLMPYLDEKLNGDTSVYYQDYQAVGKRMGYDKRNCSEAYYGDELHEDETFNEVLHDGYKSHGCVIIMPLAFKETTIESIHPTSVQWGGNVLHDGKIWDNYDPINFEEYITVLNESHNQARDFYNANKNFNLVN